MRMRPFAHDSHPDLWPWRFLHRVVAPGIRSAQTPFVPYFGKNRVHATTSSTGTSTRRITSRSTTTPRSSRTSSASRLRRERLSAHQRELKHDLADRVPLVLFKTQSEFQQQNISGGELPEACSRSPSPSATGWCCRSTSRRTSSTG